MVLDGYEMGDDDPDPLQPSDMTQTNKACVKAGSNPQQSAAPSGTFVPKTVPLPSKEDEPPLAVVNWPVWPLDSDPTISQVCLSP